MPSLGKISIIAVCLLAFAAGLFVYALPADNAVSYRQPVLASTVDAHAPSAISTYVFDVETGLEFGSKNADEVRSIASVTKLLTASLFEGGAPFATTTIMWGDVNTEGEAGKLRPYQEYQQQELVYPLILESSNDAAAVMHRVKPELLARMNSYVQELGLSKTGYGDTSGLSSENVSTARELSVLARKLRTDHPHIFDISRLKQYVGTHTGWMNNNPFVGEEGYRGGKHGFTYEAQKTAVLFFEETLATGQTRTIGYVLLGSSDLKKDVALLREEVQKNVRLE